jgi:hypothetical protein
VKATCDDHIQIPTEMRHGLVKQFDRACLVLSLRETSQQRRVDHRRCCRGGALEMQALSVAVPRDGW